MYNYDKSLSKKRYRELIYLYILPRFLNTYLFQGWLADIIEGPLRDIMQDILDQYVPEIPSKLF